MGWEKVKITADTNVLVRAMTGDDERQSRIARTALADAEIVAVAMPALCELVWILSQGYKIPASEVGEAVRRLVASANVVADRAAVAAGLAFLAGGGDFADGVIAHEGTWLGADTFASFDKAAVKLVEAQGGSARLL